VRLFFWLEVGYNASGETMSLVDIEALSFGYDDRTLLSHAQVRLFQHEHVAVVGPNGTGKSTLLNLIAGNLKPDKGSITIQPRLKIGYLDQNATLPSDHTVMSYMAQSYAEWFTLEQQMEEAYTQASLSEGLTQEKWLNRAANAQEKLIEVNFYAYKSNILRLLHGLGLDDTVLPLTLAQCSGGMRVKIMLAKLLLEENDLLLLDEPTNFLDVEHVAWLAKYLQSVDQAFLVVSHDPSFLQAIATVVWAIERQGVERYKGTFESYLKTSEERSLQNEKAYKAQTKFIAKTEAFIAKNIVREKTAKRAKSRRKMLAKLERIAPSTKQRTYQFVFPFSVATGKEVLTLKNCVIGYEEPLVEPISTVVRKGEKMVITGENGIGKTTLMKTITDRLKPLEGVVQWIDTAQIAYFAQDSDVAADQTPFNIVHAQFPHFQRRDVFALCAAYGLSADLAQRPLKTLSGGEQTKVRMALMRHTKSNVLIMDEPTHHLDQAAKEALQEALIHYPGTLLLVSHEKAFYEAICDVELTLTQDTEEEA